MAFTSAGLSHRALAMVGAAYEASWPELIRDARTVRTWQEPADELVAHLARQHGWPANLTVSYLAALRRARLWNLPDRGW